MYVAERESSILLFHHIPASLINLSRVWLLHHLLLRYIPPCTILSQFQMYVETRVEMKRRMSRLSVKEVANKKKAGNYCDGGGLYLQVSESGSKSWVFRYTLNGRDRHMGLGPFHTVSLADARTAAVLCRQSLLRKIDPIAARDAEHARQSLEAARSVTFVECATAYIKTHRPSWKNPKHADQWTNTIKTYCGPVIGPLPIQEVDTGLVMKVLEPIWTEKPETASRLRGRIESVLDWATVSGYREGENPARWRGHLENLLPSLNKKLRVKHHPALPFNEMGKFMESLRLQEGIAARALEFLILTAARTGETIGAKWEEFDLNTGIWSIPASRMKAGVEHRIPLSNRALEIALALRRARQSDYVFPGQKEGKPLTNMAMLGLLKRMGRMDLTVHGFRSSFRDWASECTNFPREVCEMALAHTIPNQAEAAYRRGDLIEKRWSLMEEWMRHCAGSKAIGERLPVLVSKLTHGKIGYQL
jgi:integrase